MIELGFSPRLNRWLSQSMTDCTIVRCRLDQRRDLGGEQLPESEEEDGGEDAQHEEDEQRSQSPWPVPPIVQPRDDRVDGDPEQPGQQQQEQEVAEGLPRPDEDEVHREQHQYTGRQTCEPSPDRA
jgi:hypothetical protein